MQLMYKLWTGLLSKAEPLKRRLNKKWERENFPQKSVEESHVIQHFHVPRLSRPLEDHSVKLVFSQISVIYQQYFSNSHKLFAKTPGFWYLINPTWVGFSWVFGI